MLYRRACTSVTGRLPTRPRPCHASVRRPHSVRTAAAGTASLPKTPSIAPNGHAQPTGPQQRVVSLAAGDGSYSCAVRTSRDGRQLIRLSHVSEDDEIVVTLPAAAAGPLCQALQQLQQPHDRPLQPISFADGGRSFTFQPLQPQQQQGGAHAASLQVTQAGRSPLVLPCSGSAGAPFAQQLLELLQPLLLSSGAELSLDSSSSSSRQEASLAAAEVLAAAKQAAAAAQEAAAAAAAADNLIAATVAAGSSSSNGSRIAPASPGPAQAQAAAPATAEIGVAAGSTQVQPDLGGLSLDSFLLPPQEVAPPDGKGDTVPAHTTNSSSTSSNGVDGHTQQQPGGRMTAGTAGEEGLTLADLTAAGWLQANAPANTDGRQDTSSSSSSSSSPAQLAKLVIESMQRNSRAKRNSKNSSSSSSSSSTGGPDSTGGGATSLPVNARATPPLEMQKQQHQQQQQQQAGEKGQTVEGVVSLLGTADQMGHSSRGTRQRASSSSDAPSSNHDPSASTNGVSSTTSTSPFAKSTKGSRVGRKERGPGAATGKAAAADVSSDSRTGKQPAMAPGVSRLLQPAQQPLSPAQAQELLEGIKAAADASALSQLLIGHLESLAAAHLVAAWLRLGQLASSSEPAALQSLTKLVAAQLQPKLQPLPTLLLQQLLAAAAKAKLQLPEGFCSAWAAAMEPHVSKLEASQLSALCLDLVTSGGLMPWSFVEAVTADAVGRLQVGQLQPPQTAAILSWVAGARAADDTTASSSSNTTTRSSSSSGEQATASDVSVKVQEGSSSAAASSLVKQVAATEFDQLLAVADALQDLPASTKAAAQGVMWRALLDGTLEPLPTHQLLQLVGILAKCGGSYSSAAEVLAQHLQQLHAAAVATTPHDSTLCNALVLVSGVLRLGWRLGHSMGGVCLPPALQLLELVLEQSVGHDAAAAEEGLVRAAAQALDELSYVTGQLSLDEPGLVQPYLPRLARVLLQAADHLHLPLQQQLECMQDVLRWCGPGLQQGLALSSSSSSSSSRSGLGGASDQAAGVGVAAAQEVLLQLPAVLLAHSSELGLTRLSHVVELAAKAVQVTNGSHGVVVSALDPAGTMDTTTGGSSSSSSSSSSSMDTPWPAAMQPVAASAAAWTDSLEAGQGAGSKAALQYSQQVMAVLQLALLQEAASCSGSFEDCQALVLATSAALQQQSTGQPFDQQLLTTCIVMARDSAAMLPSTTQQQLLWVCAKWLAGCASGQGVPPVQSGSMTQSAPQLSVSSVLQLVNQVTATLAVKPVAGIQFDQLVSTTWAIAAVAAAAERQLPGAWHPSRIVLTWLRNAWTRRQQQQEASEEGNSLSRLIAGLPPQQAVELSWAQSVLAAHSGGTLVLPGGASAAAAAAAALEAAKQLPAGWAVAAVAAAAALPAGQVDPALVAVHQRASELTVKLMGKLSGWPLLLQLQLLACLVDPGAVLCVLPWQQQHQQKQGQPEAHDTGSVVEALLRAASASASARAPGVGASATSGKSMPMLMQYLVNSGHRGALQRMQDSIWSTCTEVLQASNTKSSSRGTPGPAVTGSSMSAEGGEPSPAAPATWLTTHSQPLLGPQLLVPVALAALQLLGATGATLGRARAANLLAGLQDAAAEAPQELQAAFVKVCLQYKVPLKPQLLQAAIAGSRAAPQQATGSTAAPGSAPPPAAAVADAASHSAQMYLQRLSAAGGGLVQGSTAAGQDLLPPAADLAAWSWRDLLHLVELTAAQQLAPSQTWLTAVQSALQPKLVLVDNAKQLVEVLQHLESLGGQLQQEFLQQVSAAADVHLDSLSAASCLQLLGSCAQQGMQPTQRVLVNLVKHLERAPVQVDQVPQGMLQLLRCGIRPSAALLQHWLDVSQQRAAVLPAGHINTVLYCLWQWQVVPPVTWLDPVLINLAPAGRLSSFTAGDTVTLCHCLVQLGVTPSDQLKFLFMQHLCSVVSSCNMEQLAVAQTCLLRWGAVSPEVVTSFLQQLVKLLPTADLAAVAVCVATIGSAAGELGGDGVQGQQQEEMQAGVTALATILVKVVSNKYVAARHAAVSRHTSSSSRSEGLQAVADSLVPVMVFLQQWRPQLINPGFLASVRFAALTAAKDDLRLGPFAAHFLLDILLDSPDVVHEVEQVQLLMRSAYVNRNLAPAGISREILAWCEPLQRAVGSTELVPRTTLSNWQEYVRTAGQLEGELVARHKAAQQPSASVSPGGHPVGGTLSGDVLAVELGNTHPYLLEVEQQGLVEALQDEPFRVAYQVDVGRLQQRLGAAVAQQCVVQATR